MLKKTCFFVIISFVFILPLLKRERGFSIRKITSRHSYDPRWDVCWPDKQKKNFLNSLFQQKFYYIGSGNHCYAFASEDEKYVIKFFKQKHMKYLNWRDFLPFPEHLNKINLQDKQKRKKLREKTFRSYKYAYELLPKETGTVFLHLTPTDNLHQQAFIKGPNGQNYRIDLDRMEFVIQKKAKVGFEYLNQLFAGQEKSLAFDAIESLLSVISARCHNGLFDRDMQIFKNFGFIENNALEIDIGEFYYSTNEYAPSPEKEIEHVGWQIGNWLEKNYPKYLEEYQEMLKTLINNVNINENPI